MANNVKKLSNEAPIILTWVPRMRGASLPDGKNSNLNYLDIIKNHKLKNKEERDIYLVINGPGFEQNQIDDLKRELKGIKGVHVVDLHQYDWSEIDEGWKIDGKDISIKNFFENMYSMTEEQRTYFAIEIDTFRLIALALLKQFTKHEGGIYIDFDSLGAIDGHIGKDITIPRRILLGTIECRFRDKEGNLDSKSAVDIKNSNHCDEYESFVFYINNDCIAISNSDVVADIFSRYKDKILNQKEMCNEAKKCLSSITEEEFNMWISLVTKDEGLKDVVIKRLKKDIKQHISNFESNGIQELYNIENFYYISDLNLAQMSTLNAVKVQLDKEVNACPLFSFDCNNGNYETVLRSDMSWMKEDDLYCVEGKLEEAKVDQMVMEKLSLQ